MDGIELARQVTDMQPGTPVLMSTGSGESVTADLLDAAGVSRCVGKPVVAGELLRHLHELLHGPAPEEAYQLSPLPS